MVILATRKKEIGTNPLLDANCTFDANKEREFGSTAAGVAWSTSSTPHHRVYRVVGYNYGN